MMMLCPARMTVSAISAPLPSHSQGGVRVGVGGRNRNKGSNDTQRQRRRKGTGNDVDDDHHNVGKPKPSQSQSAASSASNSVQQLSNSDQNNVSQTTPTVSSSSNPSSEDFQLWSRALHGQGWIHDSKDFNCALSWPVWGNKAPGYARIAAWVKSIHGDNATLSLGPQASLTQSQTQSQAQSRLESRNAVEDE